MKHKHHIKPKHRGGTDADGIVEVSLTCHAMFHWCEWQRLGLDADKLAYLFLSNKTEEAEKVRIQMVKKANTGRKIVGLHRERMSAALKGRPGPIISQKQRSVNAQKQKITFRATSPEGITTQHTGIQEFCRDNNLPKSSVHRCIHNQAKSCKGWVFELNS